jgi:hypothetical protein
MEAMHQLTKFTAKHNHAGLSVFHNMRQFRDRQSEVYRDKDGPQPGACEVDLNEFRAVFQHDDHPISFSQAQGLKPAGGPVSASMEFSVGDPSTFKEDCGLIRMEVVPSLDPPGDIHGFDHLKVFICVLC